jgi:hypothetical protein
MSSVEPPGPSTFFEPMTNATFIETEGLFCPFCRSRDLEAELHFYFMPEGLTRDIQCNACHRRWIERFQLIGYRESR